MKSKFQKVKAIASAVAAALGSRVNALYEKHYTLGFVSIKYPTITDFAEQAVGIKDKIELIWQPIYDWLIFPTGGIGNLPFFQQPQGQGFSAQPLAAAAPKTVADTILTQAGMLPSPQCFWVDGLEFVVEPGGSATANLFIPAVPSVYLGTAAAASTINLNDSNIILRSGFVTFTIMQKVYYQEGPLSRFPTRSHVFYHGNQSICGTNAQPGSLSTMGAYAEGKPVRFEPGYGIKETTNFGVNVAFTANTVTTAPGSGFNARIGCFLNGWLFRAAQ